MNKNLILFSLALMASEEISAHPKVLKCILGQDYQQQLTQLQRKDFEAAYARFCEEQQRAAAHDDERMAQAILLSNLRGFLLKGFDLGMLQEYARIVDETAASMATLKRVRNMQEAIARAEEAARTWDEKLVIMVRD